MKHIYETKPNFLYQDQIFILVITEAKQLSKWNFKLWNGLFKNNIEFKKNTKCLRKSKTIKSFICRNVSEVKIKKKYHHYDQSMIKGYINEMVLLLISYSCFFIEWLNYFYFLLLYWLLINFIYWAIYSKLWKMTSFYVKG